jgi:hypothetical protein
VPRFQAEPKKRGPGNFVEIPFDPPEVSWRVAKAVELIREGKPQR